MKIIGVTGSIGSGKSYFTKLFAKEKIKTIDTDKIYHSMISKPGKIVNELTEEFGKGIIGPNGAIDRAELSKIVFSDKNKLLRLNSITHHYVTEKVKEILSEYEKKGEKSVVIEVPLMFESGFDKMCDLVICVAADDETRLKRIMKRNGFSEEEAKKRINNQKDNKFYIENSSKVVYNTDYKTTRARFREIYNEIFGPEKQ